MLNDILAGLSWGLALGVWILIFAGITPSQVTSNSNPDQIASIIETN